MCILKRPTVKSMRSFITTTSISILFALHAAAESPYERDLAQLRAQRDKSLAAATEPINRRFKESLDDLLRRATQANDLEAAVKIKDEIKLLGIDPASATTSGIPNFTDKLMKQPWTWTSGPGGRDKLEFTRDGSVIHNGWANAKWTAKKPNIVIITMGATTATLRFNEAMDAFEGTDFGNTHPVKGEHY